MKVQITVGPVAKLEQYAMIPISFLVNARLNVDRLWLGEFEEERIDSYQKDYDSLESVASLSERFDISNWALLTAHVPRESDSRRGGEDVHWMGGAIVAWNSPAVEMLEGRSDLAILWDIRVHPLFRGKGVGKTLFDEAKAWAKKCGCIELRVETQETNVGACRFYRAMGCRIHRIENDAYPGLDEAKVIWTCKI